MKSKFNNLKLMLLLAGLSYLFFMLGNGILSLTNPDEVFYAQTAKEMIQHHSWMTPYLFGAPQFEKPVLLFWLLRIGFIIFGVSSFAARFFPALFATLGVLTVYRLGLFGFKNEKKAFIAGLILMSCGFYVGMARTVFTDMIFSVWIFLSLTTFFWGYTRIENKGRGILFCFVFSALAVLTKGPLGLLIPFLTIGIFLFIRKDLRFVFSKYSVWGILIFIAISIPWYIFMIGRYRSGFINEFFYNDHIRRIIEAEHFSNDRWYFYPLSIIAVTFPWSLYVITSLFYLVKRLGPNKSTPAIYTFLISWICAGLLIFEPAHSKLTSYILPLFPALSLACADFIYEAPLFKNRGRSLVIVSLLTVIILFLIPIILIFLLPRFAVYFSDLKPIYIFSLAFLTLAFLILFFVIRMRLITVTYLTALVIPLFLLLVPFIRNDIEPYLSSKYACQYLLKNYTINQPILCSKPFVRGVRYYTDSDVVIVNAFGKNFFSPHPIPFFDSDQKVRDFLGQRTVTYAVLRKSSLEDILRPAGKNFKINTLKVIGNEYIVKIESQIK